MSVPAGTPAVMIVLPLEGRVRIIPAVLNDTEMSRPVDWLEASPRRIELLDLATEVRDEEAEP